MGLKDTTDGDNLTACGNCGEKIPKSGFILTPPFIFPDDPEKCAPFITSLTPKPTCEQCGAEIPNVEALYCLLFRPHEIVYQYIPKNIPAESVEEIIKQYQSVMIIVELSEDRNVYIG